MCHFCCWLSNYLKQAQVVQVEVVVALQGLLQQSIATAARPFEVSHRQASSSSSQTSSTQVSKICSRTQTRSGDQYSEALLAQTKSLNSPSLENQ